MMLKQNKISLVGGQVMSLYKALGIIEGNLEEADYAGEIDYQTIIDAEDKLGLKFPKSYRVFL